MYNQKTSSRRTRGKYTRNARFSHSKRSGGFRGGSSQFSARRGRSKSQKLDISSFINKTASSSVPEKIFVPEHSFADFEINPVLLRSIEQLRYAQPTPIQDKIIVPILQKKDVVGLANTGTGKTAAFLIPLIENVLQNSHEQILITTPTRELAQQIEQELRGLTKQMRIYSVACVGGEHIGIQIRKLQRKSNFIIGTPGRLIDLVKRGNLMLNEVHTVVLDEADRMLDMGFIHDIRFLMSRISEKRQTLCFSATMSTTIERLIADFLKDPSTISVKTVETPKNIEQDVIRVRNLNKVDVLHDLLKNDEFKKVLVFGRTKHGVENLSRILMRRGIKVESIHGNKTQAQRKRALLSFKQNRVQILVATDVAARGLHISNITHVINYEIPETYDDYIHRIGRTGRGTQKGKALTFID
ncbi:MAG TPA: DEAD/DEAH box helicase [Candidatus Jorgensenbacteria bacterium]|nr:DEAD/DEAH box helicase [Candidatus Jorgensenbacteria bacterium]